MVLAQTMRTEAQGQLDVGPIRLGDTSFSAASNRPAVGDTFHAIIVGECLPKTFGASQPARWATSVREGDPTTRRLVSTPGGERRAIGRRTAAGWRYPSKLLPSHQDCRRTPAAGRSRPKCSISHPTLSPPAPHPKQWKMSRTRDTYRLREGSGCSGHRPRQPLGSKVKSTVSRTSDGMEVSCRDCGALNLRFPRSSEGGASIGDSRRSRFFDEHCHFPRRAFRL